MLRMVLFSLLAASVPVLSVSKYPEFSREVKRVADFITKADPQLAVEARVLRDGGSDEGCVCIKDKLSPHLGCIFEYSAPVRVGGKAVEPPKLVLFSYSRVQTKEFGWCGRVTAVVNVDGKGKRNEYAVCLIDGRITPVIILDESDPETQVTSRLVCIGSECDRQ